VDAIADLVGSRLARAACTALRPGGQIAAIATPELDLDLLLDANITFHGVLVQDDGDRTRALAALLDRRALRPVVSHMLRLAAAAEAHRILEGATPAARSCSTSRAASHSRGAPAAPGRRRFVLGPMASSSYVCGKARPAFSTGQEHPPAGLPLVPLGR
jgi:hypothetical protein